MHPTVLTGLLAAGAALTLATLVGLLRARRDGRTRPATRPGTTPRKFPPRSAGPSPDLGLRPGRPVTLLQFSSAVCASCRAARRVCGAVAAGQAGVEHLEVDAEQCLDEVRALGIWRTPTVLVIDGAGRVVHRVSGAPREADLRAAVAALLPAGVAG